MFLADKKNSIWVGDITYVPIHQQTLYLAVFIDIYSRKVVGWSMNTKMKDGLVVDVFLQDKGKEHPPIGLIVHIDHGTQFIGSKFSAVLKEHGAVIVKVRRAVR